MSKMMLSPDRLIALLKPQGFWLREVDSVTKTISFVRQSSILKLYEHLNIYGQGKLGEAVYATTAVSGSTSHSCDACVSEEDPTLLYTLGTDKERHWTLIRTTEEAELWEKKLAQVANSRCRATTQSKGPLLRERLEPAFTAADRYIASLANVNDIFASESRYFQEATELQRTEAERLASLIGHIGESSENVELACLVLFLFASEVEGREDAFRGRKWHEDPILRVRIYLLVDFIREQRKLYAASET